MQMWSTDLSEKSPRLSQVRAITASKFISYKSSTLWEDCEIEAAPTCVLHGVSAFTAMPEANKSGVVAAYTKHVAFALGGTAWTLGLLTDPF